MIQEILQRWRESRFDFRQVACPDDPLRPLFGEWVDYYRLKAAVAETLQPGTILEIGVRYGYSYAAFKHGAPAAHYVGIDLDADTFGGERGAVEWARGLGEGSGDEFLLGNSQSMTRLPGGPYDLIHIDGQQDGAGSYHDLSLAASQGRYLLLDGYLWTRENCQNVSEFLRRFGDAIAWSLLIPGYAGELLIKVDPAFLEREGQRLGPGAPAGSESVREHYTEGYYRRHAAGWKPFAQRRARPLEDARLRGLLDLALAGRPRRLLDLGCGRGEITYQAARAGVTVTAVDYSPAALEIAKSCFEGDEALLERVEWVCASAADLPLQGEYDVVVAGNLVERMPPDELEQLYAHVRRHLAPGGRFVVHTDANAWFHRFGYPSQRRQAAALGAYLPADPRSLHERLMHLSKPSPPDLRRVLRRSFEQVQLWFPDPAEPAGSLARPMRRREMAARRGLYAVASREPIAVESLARTLSMPVLDAAAVAGVSLRGVRCPAAIRVGAEMGVTVELRNDGAAPLTSWPPYPVNLSYHWRQPGQSAPLVHDGLRTPLAPAALPGSRQRYDLVVRAPEQTGELELEITLVQEDIRWLEEVRSDLAWRMGVSVQERMRADPPREHHEPHA